MNKDFDDDFEYKKGWKDGFDVGLISCAVLATTLILLCKFLFQ